MSRFAIIRHGRPAQGGGGPAFYSNTLNPLTVTDGDSWLGNTNPPFTGNYTGAYFQAHPDQVVVNMGASGTGLDHIISDLPTIIALRPYRVDFDTGRNDFADDNRYGGSGASNAVVYAAYRDTFKTQIIDVLKAALPGVAICINTLLQWSVTSSPIPYQVRYDANRGTWNAQLRSWVADGTIAAVNDLAADATLSNTALYPDNGIHLLDYPGAGHGMTLGVPIFAAMMDGLAFPIPAGLSFDASNGWSSGQNPPALAIQLPGSGLVTGDFYRIRHSQDNFATYGATPWHEIASDDIIAGISGFIGTWDVPELPIGTTKFELEVGRGADAAHITQTFVCSQIISDTLAAPSASAILVGTTGALKSTRVNRPSSFQFIANAAIGSLCGIAADQVSANRKYRLEWHIDHLRDQLFFGFSDGVDFNAGPGFLTTVPGQASGGLGLTARCINTGEFLVYANGGSDYLVPGFVTGDSIAFEVTENASPNPTVDVYRVHAGTQTLVISKTLTSQKPVNWRAFGGGSWSDTDGTSTTDSDAATFVPKAADRSHAANTGFEPVYA